ncbi:hypothetical protein GZH53_15375 [Flavihumibacter sp. R14]|nr:hypothetical protein [Flavihumibacter soli]
MTTRLDIMSYLVRVLFLSVITICYAGCVKGTSSSVPPEFNDGGKAVENIKIAYQCESIEFENWEDDDAADSVLTICLINSQMLACVKSAEEKFEHLVAVASQIKPSLKYPEKYKSYHVVFVEQKGFSLSGRSVNSVSGDIPAQSL